MPALFLSIVTLRSVSPSLRKIKPMDMISNQSLRSSLVSAFTRVNVYAPAEWSENICYIFVINPRSHCTNIGSVLLYIRMLCIRCIVKKKGINCAIWQWTKVKIFLPHIACSVKTANLKTFFFRRSKYIPEFYTVSHSTQFIDMGWPPDSSHWRLIFFSGLLSPVLQHN